MLWTVLHCLEHLEHFLIPYREIETKWITDLNVRLLLLLLSHFSHVRLCATPETAAHQALPSRDSPGKNTGVGCHFLLQCMKVKSEREVAQSCPTLSNPMDCSPPNFSIHGIFQARVLEWGAIAFSQSYEVGVTLMFILLVKSLMLRVVQQLARGHTV